jgi:hypothetical protein
MSDDPFVDDNVMDDNPRVEETGEEEPNGEWGIQIDLRELAGLAGQFALRNGAEFAKKMLTESGHGCGIVDCEFNSMGFSCNSCGRRLCNYHLYWKIGVKQKPAPICPSCMADNHPELFD